MRTFGPPYPTHDWDATITIGELCAHDDPRGMLAWAALNYNPERAGPFDLEDEVAGLFVQIYSRLACATGGNPADAKEIERLLGDNDRVHEMVKNAVKPRLARRSA
ncbi:MAG: hypothetical protein QOI71_1648 [Gaiellales bacterium]|nr:hypothetical protein [Gaiellales bacterium]MDX6618292.1 hypothetical protein [Gaiellales bacterium]